MPTTIALPTARRVQVIIARELGADLDRVTPEARLQEDLGADYIDSLSIAMAIEDEIDVVLSDDQVASFADATVGFITAIVDKAIVAPAEAA